MLLWYEDIFAYMNKVGDRGRNHHNTEGGFIRDRIMVDHLGFVGVVNSKHHGAYLSIKQIILGKCKRFVGGHQRKILSCEWT